ncbi:hypothetical protein P4O66_003163 [Electrophorus voltai]|uniref:Uncharacterized protein n=1 Tax=Electrophorus voltai TaxID=2609070 RepID=A0AAD8YRB3_9TELE|nr:hypothetical protein P4O66_003163 [Electrophorus voltai]
MMNRRGRVACPTRTTAPRFSGTIHQVRRSFPDYGFYSSPSDQRGPPFSFADYGSLGPQVAPLLQSEHATSSCNSPLQHLPSPDQYKSPGLRAVNRFLCTPRSGQGFTFSETHGAQRGPGVCECQCTNPPRPGAFPGASSPGPVADLYGPASQDSGVGNYISAASPQPGSGFGHSIARADVHCSLRPLDFNLLWSAMMETWGPERGEAGPEGGLHGEARDRSRPARRVPGPAEFIRRSGKGRPEFLIGSVYSEEGIGDGPCRLGSGRCRPLSTVSEGFSAQKEVLVCSLGGCGTGGRGSPPEVSSMTDSNLSPRPGSSALRCRATSPVLSSAQRSSPEDMTLSRRSRLWQAL